MIFKALEFFGINTQGFDRLLVHFAGWENPASRWLAFALLIVFILSSYFLVKPIESKLKKAFVLLLHFFVIGYCILIFFQPQLRLAKVKKSKPAVAVLIDTSESMSAPTETGQTRLELAKNWLEQNKRFFDQLLHNYQLVWFSFDRTLNPISVSSLAQLMPLGKDTQILLCLDELKRELSGKLAGVLIISDGRDWGELWRASQKAKKDKSARVISNLRQRLAGLGKIYPVICSKEKKITDLAISELKYDAYGFVKNPFVVLVKIRAQGKLPSHSWIKLWQEDKLLVSKEIELKAQENEIELEFIPEQVGRFLFRVELAKYENEVNLKNNERVFPLTILRDRIRILYIVGNPSWDEKFLRRTLKKNPSVDLVSFYILREYFNNPMAREDELALIPFPTHKLFTEELASFDLVIFQNFFGKAYMVPTYIDNLREYVLEGGAFVYIGGPRAFIKDSFNDLLEDILPFDFSFQSPSYKEDEIELELTPSGEHHPITRLEADIFKSRQIWKRIGRLKGYNQVLRPKQDAVVLVRRAGGAKEPIIAVREVGKGRVLAIATDSLWRWRFDIEKNPSGTRYYQLFWERALRWLMKEKETKPISLTASKDRYLPDEEVRLLFQVQDKSYQPVDGAKVFLKPLILPKECKKEFTQPVLGEQISSGKYQFRLKLGCQGGWRFLAWAEKAGERIGEDEEIIVVEEKSRELSDLSLGKSCLELLARASGGRVFTIAHSPERLKFPQFKQEEIVGAKDIALWNNWLVFLIFVGMVSVLWALRRAFGAS